MILRRKLTLAVVAAASLMPWPTIPALVLMMTVATRPGAGILTATALVFMMTLPGLALFFGGLVQARNLLSVLCQIAVILFSGA